MAFIIVSDFSGTLSAILNLRAVPFPLSDRAIKCFRRDSDNCSAKLFDLLSLIQ